uniref:Uncharacterized protein n=1 Tax=Ovis aries TaxID=9940 RepID=A0AC11ENV6_SHEEP
MDWLDLLAVQGTLKTLLQHHSSKASILQRPAFFIVQLSHPYMTTGRTIALTRWTLVDKALSRLSTHRRGFSNCKCQGAQRICPFLVEGAKPASKGEPKDRKVDT